MRKEIHLIAHAHIDPVWLWDWREGLREIVSTFAMACQLIEEHPEYRFTASSAAFYNDVALLSPELAEKIRRYVAEGRWAPVGGWWVEPDVNLPSGEGLLRQGIYGKRLMHRLLGVKVRVGFNPDTFGHPEGIPKILRALDQDCYFFMRPEEHEKHLPGPVFRWRSADGSEVLAVRILGGYGTDGPRLREKVRTLREELARSGLPAIACFYGTGDHGGGPSRESLRILDDIRREVQDVAVVYSTPDRYAELLSREAERLPVVQDELQHHARGCYSVNRGIKWRNRRAEHTLLALERWSALAWLLLGEPFPQEKLEEHWRVVLFEQFHDILAGTSIESACADAERAQDRVLHWADERTELTLRKLAARVPVSYPRGGFVVFNPWPWEVKLPIEFEYLYGDPERQRIFAGPDGRGLAIQHIQRSDLTTAGRSRWVLVDSLPPLGYKRYEWTEAPVEKPHPGELSASVHRLANRWLEVWIDPDTGEWSRLLHRGTNRDILARRGCTPLVLPDASDTWSHGVEEYAGQPRFFGRPTLALEEDGPVRAVVRCERQLGCSELVSRTIVYADLPYVFLDLEVNWQEPRSILQLHFPLLLGDPEVVAEQAYGHVTRKPTGGEEPCQQWIDVCGETERGNGATGLLIVNDGVWSHSMRNGVLRLTLLRSPIYAHHDPAKPDPSRRYHHIDIGLHRFRFLFYPHAGDWRSADPYRLAAAFNAPPRVVVMPVTNEDGPAQGSWCEIAPENVVATVLKKAFDDGCLVIRCFETHGRQTDGRVRLLPFGAEGQFSIGPYQLKTYAVRREGNALRLQEISALEWELVQP